MARELGISRSSLYYVSKQFPKDWEMKRRVEGVLQEHPGYGYRRVALELGVNKKRTQRVMRLFGIKPYRRRGRKPRRADAGSNASYPNLLRAVCPARPNHIWVSDFSYLPWKAGFLYLATVMDLFTREIVGWALLQTHSVQLVLQAFFVALQNRPRPAIFHSDNGREYNSKQIVQILTELDTRISRSAKGCPWENGYQESFYSQFKVDLGDPGRFKTWGQLVYEIYRLLWRYNHTRIHSALKMPPLLFRERYEQLLEKAS